LNSSVAVLLADEQPAGRLRISAERICTALLACFSGD
jgi:hypothetical protein